MFRRMLLAGLVLTGSMFYANSAQAWHGHHFGHHFGHHYYGGYGGYGGHFYRPFYGSYYGGFGGFNYYRPFYSNYYYRPYVFPRYTYYYNAYPSCYYTQPVYYSSYCYTPIVTYPVSSPIILNSWSSTDVQTVPVTSLKTSSIVQSAQIASNPSRSPASILANLPSKLDQSLTTSAIVGRLASVDPSTPRAPKASQPAVLTTYSPVWTKSAVGLIDSMVAEGEIKIANDSCVRMESIKSAKDSSVYLRQAILGIAARGEQLDSQSLNHALDYFNRAAATGSEMSGAELPGESLGKYLEQANIDVNRILDLLAQRVLDKPENSGRELLLLTTLLKLDGQNDRSQTFALAAQNQAIDSDSFQWFSLLRVFQPSDLVATN